MWISKIELINFKSYQHQVFTFPKMEKGKNLTLIGGMNGFGKTTLLEAIYLCFFGSEATSHLGRAGLAEDSYGKFLKNAFHGKAKLIKRDFMAVNLAFETDGDTGYEIRRKWFFTSSGAFDEEDLQVCNTNNGVQDKFLDNVDLPEILLNHAVPAHIAPFFFFDGEELKRNADQNRTSFVLMGLENLLGVVHLRNLKERLENYANNRLQGTTKVNKDELAKKVEEYEQTKSQKELLQKELDDISDKIKNFREKRDEVHLNIQSTGAGSGDKKQIEETLDEEGQRKSERDKVQDELNELLTLKLPFSLISKDLKSSLEFQLKAEQILYEWQNRKEALTPQKGKFKTSFFEEIKDFKMLSEEEVEKHLIKAIDSAWESIYTPEPEGCAASFKHDYLDPKQKTTVIDLIKESRVSGEKIKERSINLEKINERIFFLARRRVQLQSILGDGQLQEWLDELRDLDNKIEDLKQEEGDLSRQNTSLHETLNQLQAIIERERKRLLESTPQMSYASKAQKVIDFINELLPSLFLLKTQEVSKAVTYTFKDLSHKKLVDKITVNEKGESKIYDANGAEISVDLSAGEKQMFVTSMIAGLAKVSGFAIPFVVDTPMGRLDSEHRQGIINYWINTGRQVILLSQDKEIGPIEYQSIKKHVNKTYLLEHIVLGEGIGRTIAHENKYFEKVAI